MKQFIIAILFIFLIGCTTTHTPIVTISCNPDSTLMLKQEEFLPKIEQHVMTEEQILNLLVLDDMKLLEQRRNTNALIDHINTFCKG